MGPTPPQARGKRDQKGASLGMVLVEGHPYTVLTQTQITTNYSTPCPEKMDVLGITLTKFNKFSQFLAQFMLTYQLTKKL